MPIAADMPRLVADASAVVLLLTDRAARGEAVRRQVEGADVHAPALLPYEVQNVLRRLERHGRLSPDVASLASRDLEMAPITLWPYALTASRTWSLRHNLSAYDAAYVAVAEALDCPLLTADTGIASVAKDSCSVTLLD